MNQTLKQIEEEFVELFDKEIVGGMFRTEKQAKNLEVFKSFLTQSNLRVIEKVKEWAEKGDRRVRDWKPSTYGEIEIARLAEESILDDLKHFLSHAE